MITHQSSRFAWSVVVAPNFSPPSGEYLRIEANLTQFFGEVSHELAGLTPDPGGRGQQLVLGYKLLPGDQRIFFPPTGSNDHGRIDCYVTESGGGGENCRVHLRYTIQYKQVPQ